jgi:hypothetical protein
MILWMIGCAVVVGTIAGAGSWHYSSDRYIWEHMEAVRSFKLEFNSREWLMVKIVDAGTLPPWHYPGAVYSVDSVGRKRKISDGYVKPEHFTTFMLTNALAQCNSADEAWTNSVWRYLFSGRGFVWVE